MDKYQEMMLTNLFDLNETIAKDYLGGYQFPWEVLADINSIIMALIPSLGSEYVEIKPDVYVAQTVTISPTADLHGPAIIGPNTEIRSGAFVRGNALVGANCVIGNSTELKNVILFNNVQVPHYNYVGDAILGYKAHMGAGSITSNVKGDKSDIFVKGLGEPLATHRHKFGAMLGDRVEIGCNSVLNPGTVIGRNSRVYPLNSVRGFVPAHHIFKSPQEVVPISPALAD